MSEVNQVSDLSGAHVARGTVKVFYRQSILEGILEGLSYSTQYGASMSGKKFYTVHATLTVDGVTVYNVPLSAPAVHTATNTA